MQKSKGILKKDYITHYFSNILKQLLLDTLKSYDQNIKTQVLSDIAVLVTNDF